MKFDTFKVVICTAVLSLSLFCATYPVNAQQEAGGAVPALSLGEATKENSKLNAAAPQAAESDQKPPSTKSAKDENIENKPLLAPEPPPQVALPDAPAMLIVPGLEEPLVATGDVTDEETAALKEAVATFKDLAAKAGDDKDFSDYAAPLDTFVKTHPASAWNAAILTDLGLGYYHAGYYSQTFDYWKAAWAQGKDAKSPQATAMVDRAIGELARMHARLGHEKELTELFSEIGTRPVSGVGAPVLQGAREGLWSFRHTPGTSFLCGPRALENILRQTKAPQKQVDVADNARSSPGGFSLKKLSELSTEAGLKHTIIYRKPGQPIPVPSIINWSVHHYAAITERRGDIYLLEDPTFGDAAGLALTAKAIDAEASGYFIVPAAGMKAAAANGWRSVKPTSPEIAKIYGMGTVTGVTPGTYGTGDTSTNTPVPTSPCSACMASGQAGQPLAGPDKPQANLALTTASGMILSASLHLEDTPVGYQPQKGFGTYTTISYNQAESQQPANFTFSNLSARWSHTWMSYIQDDPATGHEGLSLNRMYGGGGGLEYGGYSTTTGAFKNARTDFSTLIRNPATGTATQYTRVLPDGSTQTYSLSDGATVYPRKMFLTSLTDAQGNTTTLNYDASLRLTSVTDAMGRNTTFTYGIAASPLLITKITDPFGRFSQMTYDASGRLASVTDPAGITSSYTYGSPLDANFVSDLTTPYGTSHFNSHYPQLDAPVTGSKALQLTDPLGYSEFVYWNMSPTIVPSADPDGVPANVGTDNGYLNYRNVYVWGKHAFTTGVPADSCHTVLSEDFTQSTIYHFFHDNYHTAVAGRELGNIRRPLEKRLWFEYPSQGTSTAGILDHPHYIAQFNDDGSTSEVTYVYNTASGLPISFKDALARETQYNYDTNNLDLLTVKQKVAAAYVTSATYAGYTNHLPATYTGPDGQIWHYTYTTAGQIKTVQDPALHTTTYNYDASNRLSTVVNANTQTVLTLTYDAADRIATRTDSQGYVLGYTYDNLDRVTKITYPDTTTDLFDYSFQSGPYVGMASTELRKYTDRLGRITTYNYDANRRLTSVVEPLAGSTTRTTAYDYYEDGTLKNLTDAKGNVTHWEIDLESRPTSKTYAYGTAAAKTETYAYEASNSRLHSITDALGQVKTFTYNVNNEVTGIAYTASVNPTPNASFTYDTSYQRIATMVDGTGTTTYNYAAINTLGGLRVSSIVGPYTNDTLGISYDNVGRLAGLTIAGGNETFGYDAINRLNSHLTPLGSFTNTYLGETDQITSRAVTTGSITATTSWGYDTNVNDRRLISITNSGVSRSYTLGYGIAPVNPYDIMSITDTAAAGHPWATQSHAYTYDKADRLLTGTSTTPGNFTYAYDAIDNATTWTTPSGTKNPTYNALNQVSTWGTLNYVYDSNGNLTSGDGLKTYKWDAENRLIEIDYTAGGKTQFVYNGIGQRRVVTETAAGGAVTTTRHLWCGGFICQTRSGTDVVQRRQMAEGELNVTTGQKLVYMPDQLGATRDVLDATTGTRVQSYDYEPYGGVARSNGTTPTDYQYASLMAHPASTLNLSATRAYDPSTGRWLNKDPIREMAGINLYGYTNANPTNETDSSGMFVGEAAEAGVAFCIAFPHVCATTATAGLMWYYNYTHPQANPSSSASLPPKAPAGSPSTAPPPASTPVPPSSDSLYNSNAATGCPPTASNNDSAYPDLPQSNYSKEHTKNARPSTEGKHQKGQARKNKDYGQEKGDDRRRVPRNKPPGWAGPWPPREGD